MDSSNSLTFLVCKRNVIVPDDTEVTVRNGVIVFESKRAQSRLAVESLCTFLDRPEEQQDHLLDLALVRFAVLVSTKYN